MTQFSRGAAYDFLARKYGGVVVDKQSDHLALNPSLMVENDSERVFLCFVNTHPTNDVYIAPNLPRGTGEGIKLSANGGLLSMDIENDATLPTYKWWVNGGGAETIYILELRRDIMQAPPERS